MKKILTTTAALAMAFGLAACGASDNGSAKPAVTKASSAASAASEEAAVEASETPAAEEAPAANTLTLTATNIGKGTVSWGIGGSMSTAEFEGEWTQQIELTDKFDIVTLTVQGDFMADNNDLKCTITDAKGEVVDEATGSGQGAFASCNFTDKF